jgi:hypothetical protein
MRGGACNRIKHARGNGRCAPIRQDELLTSIRAGNTCHPTVAGTVARRMRAAAVLCGLATALAAGPDALAPIAVAGETGRSLQPQATWAIEPVLPATLPLGERWAASLLIVRQKATFDTTPSAADAASRPDQLQLSQAGVIAAGTAALLTISLLVSLLLVILQTTARGRRPGHSRAAASSSRPLTEADYEAACHRLFQSVTTLWARAETAVFDLDEAQPLRSLLFKEMKQISQRLAMDPSLQVVTKGAVTAHHDQPYWRALSRRLNQSAGDLKRIGTVAEAAGAGFGSRSSEPRIPKTRDEACFILGANREADPETLQRLVKALRQCWHPDLAQTEQDRRYREARLKQINAAHDLITGKRVEG